MLSAWCRNANCCWRVPAVLLLISAVQSPLGAVALTTVLDPGGFPLLSSQPPAWRHAGSDSNGLRRVDLVEMGSFRVQHSSTTVIPSATSRLHLDESIQPAQLLQQLVSGTVQERDDASGVPGAAAVASNAPPLILLNGHVCALSLAKLKKTHNGNERRGFELREPYEWESDDEAAGFLLPRWMWSAVGGETVGGGLLMMAATRTSNTSEPTLNPSSWPGRQGDGAKPATADNAAAGDAAAAGLGERGFQPFVQLASWGHGSFTPLAHFTSGGMLLGGGGGGGGVNGAGEWGVPPGVGVAAGAGAGCQLGSGQEERCRHGDRAHFIRTGEGSLEIAPAGDLHLRAGAAQPGPAGSEPQGAVRIAARGKHGTIGLDSTLLVWTSSSSSASPALDNSSSGVTGCSSSGSFPPKNTSCLDAPFVRVDGDRLEAVGFSDVIRLSAGRSFDLAVAGAGVGVGEKGVEEDQAEGGAGEHAKGGGKEPSRLPGSGLTTSALLRGDSGSLNASAGVVSVEAADMVLVKGANGARLVSASGDTVLGASGRNGSVVLAGGSAIRGAAPTVSFTAANEGFPSGVSRPDATDQAAVDDGRMLWAGGGYLNLTAGAARVGGPPGSLGGAGASVEAGEKRVRLRASNSSLLHVSPVDISLRTQAIVLFSSPSPALLAARDDNEDSTGSDHPPTNTQESAGPGAEAARWSRLSLDGGALAINATASAELEAPGASLRLVGRRCGGDKAAVGSGDCGSSSGSANGEDVGQGVLGTNAGLGLGLGELVADADAVLIRARSASAGVSIVADGAGSLVGGRASAAAAAAAAGQEVDDVRDRRDDEASAGGRLEVSPGGVSVGGISTILASSRRVSLRVNSSTAGREGLNGGGEAEAGGDENGGSSSVDLGTWGVRVLAGVSAAPSESTDNSILLRAASRLVLAAHEVAISNGGGGLWMKGSALTGRADEHVLLQAGTPSSRSEGSDGASTAGSLISLRESLIHVRAGVEAGHASRGAPADDSDTSSSDDGRKGLLVEVAGLANVSSTEGLHLHTAREIRIRSSTETALYSPRGILLSGENGDRTVTGGAWNIGAPRNAAGRGDNRLPGQQAEGGHILLTPGAGSGVGIGPAFSAGDLVGASGAVPSLLYVTNATTDIPASQQRLLPPPDALVAVASSGGDSGVSVLSPRGSTSAIQFGCEELPYTGGLRVHHHRAGAAGDLLVLELASSPGRLVGDARGSWGIGAVPLLGGPTKTAPQLAAALHVFGAPVVAASEPADGPAAATAAPVAVLVEAAAGTAGVVQLLSDGEEGPYPLRAANAIVLSSGSRQSGRRRHSHWVMSQLAAGAEMFTKPGGRVQSAPRPRWADPQADRSSWAGGMALTHVASEGGASDWRPALGMPMPASSAPPAETGENGELRGSAPAAAAAEARPVVALGAGGRSGFGTASTGARVTVGGALVAEQVLVFSDEGMVRDIEELGAQGGGQAIETIRQVGVVRFGWTREASESYGLDLEVRQTGIIAQQVEQEAPPWANGLVLRDAATGRKALSHSRLLVTLVAAFQHLDGSVSDQGETWDARLGELERALVSAEERSVGLSERLGGVEAMAATGFESLLAQTRNVSALEGRLSQQGEQVEEAATVLSRVQESAAQERGTTQEWRMQRDRREQELEKEVVDLKARLAELEEQQAASREDQEVRRKAQDEQIRALSLRIGSVHASQSSSSSKCDASLLAEMEELRNSHDAIQERLAGLDQRILHRQDSAFNEEVFFLEEVRRIEDRLRDGLRRSAAAAAAMEAASGAATASSPPPGAGGGLVEGISPSILPVPEEEIRKHLEEHKEGVRLEALTAVQRHREHVAALRQARA